MLLLFPKNTNHSQHCRLTQTETRDGERGIIRKKESEREIERERER